MDTNRIRQLLDQRDELDRELASAVNGATNSTSNRKPASCSKCGEEGHTARTCAKVTPLPVALNGNDQN